MAPYTPDRRRKNQLEVLGFTALLLFATLIAYSFGRIGTVGLVAAAIGCAVIGSVLWWLFASKSAGDVTNTWVEKGLYAEDHNDAHDVQAANILHYLKPPARPLEHYDEQYEAD